MDDHIAALDRSARLIQLGEVTLRAAWNTDLIRGKPPAQQTLLDVLADESSPSSQADAFISQVDHIVNCHQSHLF
jgi:hypothetical protein